MQPTAKSLIVDLLSTMPRSARGSMPVRALVAAGACFEIAENSIRVALARLLQSGTVDRDERGRYRLGARTEAVRSEVASWRTRHGDLREWTAGSWVGVLATPRPGRVPRREQQLRARALGLLGFRALGPQLHVRPDNLEGGAARARERLERLDPGVANGASVMALGELDPDTEACARGLWAADETARAYRESLDRIEASEAHLHRLATEEAMVETFLIGGQVLRQIALDPLLPEEIVPAAGRRALVDAMLRYDARGRACWADFLARFEVPHLRAPADLRVAESTLPVAEAADASPNLTTTSATSGENA